MNKFRCPECGIGEQTTQVIPSYTTHIANRPVRITDARIAFCDHCAATSVHATELARWEQLEKEQRLPNDPLETK